MTRARRMIVRVVNGATVLEAVREVGSPVTPIVANATKTLRRPTPTTDPKQVKANG